jgi:hypothetical protein
MKPIDFDAAFSKALGRWIEENRGRYKTADEMEDAAPAFYTQWLNTPADFLSGETPDGFFARYDNAGALIDLMQSYIGQGVPVPDPLLSRLREIADEEALFALVTNNDAPAEARMHAIDMLREMESELPMVSYIRWQAERNLPEELLDAALESLSAMGSKVLGPAKIAFTAANDAGKEALLDILCNKPGDDDVLLFAIRRFQACADKRALYASYLGKLDDDRALEPLLIAAEQKDVCYIDFIEIRNAIERLGGEALYRDFSDDPTYQAVQRLQVR